MKTNISVVIPSYKVTEYILDVIKDIPEFVNHIIVVDDKCPQNSGQIAKTSSDSRVIVCYHEKNLGVGGAVVTGYKKALELNSDIVIKIDGDGQMDVNYMQKLIQPILDGKADYTKGNRFTDFKALRAMPKVRLFGNSGLSFLVKAASGYWNLMDPTNGYTAINKHALEELDLDNIAKRYFFESDMLINLNIENAVVFDVEIPAKYGDEKSSLSITKTLVGFPPKLFKGLCKRIFLKYFIYDFNMLSLYLVVGLPMLLFGIVFGSIKWIEAIVSNIETSTGTIMLAVLPIILGTQFILQAIQIDMNNIPRKEK
ncbi:glycosyltransferase family 2 protein [Arcobacter aquimarinus]|uniref:glycosyltransferase family 2 protein n=1 Tax=Arcobacter aquimarinus TaxID=1315211 RepID=UPI003BAE8E65